MEDFIYPLSLLLAAALAFIFYRNNSHVLMLLSIAALVYMVYSHETGFSSQNIKEQISETIDESLKNENP